MQRVRACRSGHCGIDGRAVDEGVGAAAVEREAHSAHRLAGAYAAISGQGKLRRNNSAVRGVVDGDLRPCGKTAAHSHHGEDEVDSFAKAHSDPSILLVAMGLPCGSERRESDFAAQQPILQVAHLSKQCDHQGSVPFLDGATQRHWFGQGRASKFSQNCLSGGSASSLELAIASTQIFPTLFPELVFRLDSWVA
jgi:hypothetical protein